MLKQLSANFECQIFKSNIYEGLNLGLKHLPCLPKASHDSSYELVK